MKKKEKYNEMNNWMEFWNQQLKQTKKWHRELRTGRNVTHNIRFLAKILDIQTRAHEECVLRFEKVLNRTFMRTSTRNKLHIEIDRGYQLAAACESVILDDPDEINTGGIQVELKVGNPTITIGDKKYTLPKPENDTIGKFFVKYQQKD